jgi:hypothetical protein
VKNRSADDQQSTSSARVAQEEAEFGNEAWRELARSERCGIASLKTRFRRLLMDIIKKEFPHVKADVAKRLEKLRSELKIMGPSRTDQSAQRMYITQLASKFEKITQCALHGYYDSEAIFAEAPGLKLITIATKMNEAFADLFWRCGHMRHTSSNWSDEGEAAHSLSKNDDNDSAEHILLPYAEIQDIIEISVYKCQKPKAFNDDSIMARIDEIYQLNRGPELGTVSTDSACFECDIH